MYTTDYLNILIENIISYKRVDDISDIIMQSEINYVSTAGTVSKTGFGSYRKFIKKLRDEQQKETMEVDRSTVWDRIKRIEGKKNGV